MRIKMFGGNMMLTIRDTPAIGSFAIVTTVLLAILSGCGGGSGGGSSPTPPSLSPTQLVSIAVSPSNPVVPLGISQQFVATGTYSDGTLQNVTGLVSWSSSNTSVAQVNDQASKGLASSAAVGTTTIAAMLNGIGGSTPLTVGPAALVSIGLLSAPNVSPPSTNQIAIAAELQFVAAGHYTDNTIQDITDLAIWSSSDTGVAVISNVQGKKGLANGVAAGAVTIESALGSVKATAGLTVLPIKALDFGTPNTMAPGLGGLGMDGDGNALAVWNYQFTGSNSGIPPQIYTTSYSPGSGWGPKTLIDFGAIDDFPAIPALAVNASGTALLAWTGHGGVYASKYTPGAGWQQARVITSGASPFLTFAESLRIAIDANGNGLLVWANDNGDILLSSQYQALTDTWTTPQALPNVNRGLARSAFSLATNAGGSAVLLWENWTFGASPAWTLYASLFSPGAGQGTGWQTPQPLHQSESYQTPTAAISDSGAIVATWVEYESLFPNTSLYARRFIPNQGWQALQEIAFNDINRPADPQVAMNDQGNAVVVWRTSYDKTIRASRFVVGASWQTPETLYTGVPPGDPTVLRPHIASDGRLLAAWVTADVSGPFKVGLRRYVPGNGWENAQWLAHIHHKGGSSGINLAFNSSGIGAALWTEGYGVIDSQFLNFFSDIYANTQLAY
jgi:Bacterial Ig-like domain (group 2)